MTAADDGLDSRSRALLWASLAIGAALSLAATVALATQSVVLGSVEGGWAYAYVQPITMRILVIAVAAAVVTSALQLVPLRVQGRQWGVLFAWIAAASATHAVLRNMAPHSLEALFVSDSANSFYSVTLQNDAADVLERFSRFRSQAPLHARSNLPGKVMLLYALELITARPAALAWLIVIISNLGAIFMYLFVRDLFGEARTALFAAVLYLFVPARIFFFPLMNTVTPVAVLVCACVLMRWLRTGRTVYAMAMGAALYALVFFEPLPLVIGLLFAALVLRAIACGATSWARFIPQAGLMVLVFVAASETINRLFGFELIRAMRQIAGHAVEFNVEQGRPYGIWVAANLREFVFGTGLCQIAAFLGAAAYGLRGGIPWRERLTRPIATVCLALAAVLAATDLIGVNRGEVIRLWIFLACFFQVPAAYVCSTLRSRGAMALVVFCTVLETALGAALIGFVVP